MSAKLLSPLRQNHSLLSLSLLSFALLSLSILGGCSDSSQAPQAPSEAKSNPATDSESTNAGESQMKAQALLAKVRQTYREAKSYVDNSTVVFYAVSRATGSENETPFHRSSIALQRPNQLHLTLKKNVGNTNEEIYEIVSNGSVVRAIADGAINQVHEAIAPPQFTSDNFILDPEMKEELLSNAIENTWPQLAMLLASDKATTVFPDEKTARLIEDAELDGKKHQRIEILSLHGKRELWIDPTNFTLRRMVIPTDSQAEILNGKRQFSKFQVWIDFENISLDLEIDTDTFELAIPEGYRRVRRFIGPPQDDQSQHLGNPIGQFAFETLDGKAITPETLADKVAVLDFWFTTCPPCQAQTPVMQQVYDNFKKNEDVAFYAISIDDAQISNEKVKTTMANWGGELPILRDPNSTSYHELQVSQAPSLLLVDRKGRLQKFMLGSHADSEPVIKLIQRLVDGDDLVAEERDKYTDYLVKYEKLLDAATIKDTIIEVEVVQPEIPARKLPAGLTVKQLWQSTPEQLKRPGDVLLVNEAKSDNEKGSFRLLALDGGEAIVEFDDTGKLLSRHELPNQDQSSGGFLRSWPNDQGERWILASGVGWQQVHLFDSNWKSTLSFPDEQHAGIGDVLFDDLTGSGKPIMYVGYWGGLGIQGGTLDGRRLWTNRRLNHVLQLGPGPMTADGKRTNWCTSTRGTLTLFGADGKLIQELYVSDQTLMYFASLPTKEKYCGLSISTAGQYTAVGFEDTGEPNWEYPLPAGEYVEPIPRLQSVQLPNGDQAWLVVAANGSLHWLSETGELVAKFDYGDIITGVAMQTVGDQTVLLVSTSKQLTAWEVKSASAPPQPKTEDADKEETDEETSPETPEEESPESA